MPVGHGQGATADADAVDDANLAVRVRELVDRQAIQDCLLRYTRGVDRVDADLIRSAFFPDAIDAHGRDRVGTIESFLDWWLPLQRSREAAQHYVTNRAIDLDGDQAHVETYFFCVIKQRGQLLADLSGGRYVDRLERRNGEWRIALRVVLSEWKAETDASTMARLQDRALDIGRRSRQDPSYDRPLSRARLGDTGQ